MVNLSRPAKNRFLGDTKIGTESTRDKVDNETKMKMPQNQNEPTEVGVMLSKKRKKNKKEGTNYYNRRHSEKGIMSWDGQRRKLEDACLRGKKRKRKQQKKLMLKGTILMDTSPPEPS